MGLANYLQLSGIADHDELSATFDQVEPPASNFGDKGCAANLTLDIAHGAADNS